MSSCVSTRVSGLTKAALIEDRIRGPGNHEPSADTKGPHNAPFQFCVHGFGASGKDEATLSVLIIHGSSIDMECYIV